mmetsp:Transcript_11995/g.25330  ORF Transcript_11995/g.25330 Transcript_11995/m.25330 type:complete len:522 (+) Transcript_11995:29-1594(+)
MVSYLTTTHVTTPMHIRKQGMLELLSARIALSYTPCIHHTWHSGGVLQPLDRALSRGGGTQSVLGVWAVCVPMLFILCLQSDCPPCLHKPCGHGGTMEGRQALGGHTHERVQWTFSQHSTHASSCGVWDGSFCSSCRVDAPSAQLCCLIRLGCRAVLDNVWQDGLELSPSVLLELEGLENELPAEQKTFLVWTLSGRLAGAYGSKLKADNVRLMLRAAFPGLRLTDVDEEYELGISSREEKFKCIAFHVDTDMEAQMDGYLGPAQYKEVAGVQALQIDENGAQKEMVFAVGVCPMDHFFKVSPLAQENGWQPGEHDGQSRLMMFFKPGHAVLPCESAAYLKLVQISAQAAWKSFDPKKMVVVEKVKPFKGGLLPGDEPGAPVPVTSVGVALVTGETFEDLPMFVKLATGAKVKEQGKVVWQVVEHSVRYGFVAGRHRCYQIPGIPIYTKKHEPGEACRRKATRRKPTTYAFRGGKSTVSPVSYGKRTRTEGQTEGGEGSSSAQAAEEEFETTSGGKETRTT